MWGLLATVALLFLSGLGPRPDDVLKEHANEAFEERFAPRFDAPSGTAEPWNGNPPLCGQFSRLSPGDLIYVPPVYPPGSTPWTADSLSAYTATTVDQAALIVGQPGVPTEIGDDFGFAVIQWQCMGFLRKAVVFDNGLVLPQQPDLSACEAYVPNNVAFLAALGYPPGLVGLYTYPYLWNTLPLTNLSCATWTDLPLGEQFNTTLLAYPAGSYTVNNATVPTALWEPYFSLTIPGCDASEGLEQENLECSNDCSGLLPIGPTGYAAIETLDSVLCMLGAFCCAMFLLITLYAAPRSFYTIPRILFPLAAASGLGLYGAIFAPRVFGYNNVLCGGGVLLPLGTQGNVDTQQETDFYVSISGFEATGGECTAQGVFIYISELSEYTIAALLLFFFNCGAWGLFVHRHEVSIPAFFRFFLFPDPASKQKIVKATEPTRTGAKRWAHILRKKLRKAPEKTGAAVRSGEWWKKTTIAVVRLLALLSLIYLGACVVGLAVGVVNDVTFRIGSTYCFPDVQNTDLDAPIWITPLFVLAAFGGANFVSASAAFVAVWVANRHTKRSKFWKKLGLRWLRMFLAGAAVLVGMIVPCATSLYRALGVSDSDTATSDFLTCTVVNGEQGCTIDAAPEAMAIFDSIAVLGFPMTLLLAGTVFMVLEQHGRVQQWVARRFSASTGKQMTMDYTADASYMHEVTEDEESVGSRDKDSADLDSGDPEPEGPGSGPDGQDIELQARSASLVRARALKQVEAEYDSAQAGSSSSEE